MLLVSLALAVGGILAFVFIPTLMVYMKYPWPSYVLLGLSVVTAFGSRAGRWKKGAVVGFTSVLLVSFVLITGYLPKLDRPRLAVDVGDRFPDFTLTTSRNEPFSPADLRGKSAALFIFYRGDW